MEYSSSQTCLTTMGMHVTCHLAQVTFPPLPKLIKAGTVVLGLATPAKGCKAELT